MSDNIAMPSHDEEATSGTSSRAHEPCWIETSPKPSSKVCYYKQGVNKDAEKTLAAVGNDDERNKFTSSLEHVVSQSFIQRHEKGDDTFNYYLDAAASRPVVVFERHFSNDNFTSLGQGGCHEYQTFLFREKKLNDGAHSRESRLSDGSGTEHDPSKNKNKNFLPFLLKQQSRSQSQSQSVQTHSTANLFSRFRRLSDVDQEKLYRGCQLDRVPCSVRNVETVRICAMADDDVDNSSLSPSKRAHHFRFTKEAHVNSAGHQVISEPTLSPDVGSSRPLGVKIQPLWNSSDSEEKGNTSNPSNSKANSRNESSAEADAVQTVQIEATLSGMASSPIIKDDMMDENIPRAAFDSTSEKTRSKRPIAEIPDINEVLPGLQPAVSSTSRSESNARQGHALGPDHGNRWIKRLKLSSSDSLGVGSKSSEIAESSSREKFNMFFNRIIKSNLDPVLREHHGKEPMVLDHNLETLRKSGPSLVGSKKRDQTTTLGCSWIQRWCQHRTERPPPRNPEPLVICEPHSLKIGPEKQFPSVAAMALMGKAINGFRPCEFRKRGSVVVWNTKEY